MMSKNKLCMALLIAAIGSAMGADCSAEQLAVAGKGGQAVRIVCAPNKDIAEMGQYLQRFLSDRGFAVEKALAKSSQGAYAGPQWRLFIDSSRFSKDAKDEAFVLNASKTGSAPVVNFLGKTASGLRAAVARFLQRSANDGTTLWLESGREAVDPFIKLRLMNVGQAARRQAPPGSPFEDANYETWNVERIRAYPEMMWQLGYNGIQVDECRGYGAIKGEELQRARRAVLTVSQGAHDWHLYVSLSQWGDVLFDERITNCWNDPKEHQVMVDFIHDFANIYAKYADNITCRFCDPGGCTKNGCDLYKTPQLITAEYYKAFRKINPSISCTLSLWANNAFWDYCPKPVDLSNYGTANTAGGHPLSDGAKFLDTTYMPGDVEIALHRTYNSQQAHLIADSGRLVDVKGWYIGDQEMNDNMTLNMTNVNSIFSALPDEARNFINSQTVEMCFHALPQVINHYVAAQKLIDPKRPLDAIMHEFCTAAFGPQNADAMVQLYFACENTADHVIPQPADFGTAAYNAKLRDVLAKAQGVKLAPDWKPNFHFPVPVQKYVDMLTARLRLTLAVSETKQAVDEARTKMGIDKKVVARSIHIDVQDDSPNNVISTGGRDASLVTTLEKGHTIGQTFTASKDFERVGVLCTTWGLGNAGMKMALYDGVGGKLLIYAILKNIPDMDHVWLHTRRPAGTYYLEFSDPTGDKVGIFNSQAECPGGQLMADQKPVEAEKDAIVQIKEKAIQDLPVLPIDPVYKQDATVVYSGYKLPSIAELIEQL